MAQDKIKINDKEIFQPDEGLGYDFETTYAEDSGRVQSGKMHASPLFTVEALGYEATDIPVADAATILREVATGKFFTLHYFSPYYNEWRDAKFYVGKGSLAIGRLTANDERISSLSFNMIGVDKIG